MSARFDKDYYQRLYLDPPTAVVSQAEISGGARRGG